MAFRKYTLSVVRETINTTPDDAGDIQPGTVTDLTIRASVQPIERDQLMSLPQLRDRTEAYKLFSDTPLLIDEAGVQKGDIVTIFGSEYEVVMVNPWQNGIISHYEMVVAR